METNEHHVDHVEDTVATRFIGIVLGLLVIATCVGIQKAMGWHPVSGGIMTGLMGMVLGAGGTSTHGPIRAAIFGWAGGIAFFTSLAMFVGLRFW